MPLKLILMRHMKSSWDSPGDDHDRPLNARGTADAPRIGAWLTEHGHLPDAARVSSAQRTRETWQGISSAFGASPDVTFVETLYLADPEQILSVIRRGGGNSLLIVGHNPGMAEAAALMAESAPNDIDFDRYPTGATTVLEIDARDWSTVTWGEGRVLDFVVPRALSADKK